MGFLKRANPDAKPICVGSHADTQPNSGKYDGLFGVMAGLEAIISIKESGKRVESSLILVDWTNGRVRDSFRLCWQVEWFPANLILNGYMTKKTLME